MQKMRGIITGADSETREIIITCPESIKGTTMGVEVEIIPIPPKRDVQEQRMTDIWYGQVKNES